jgi:DNA-binding NtrC family response regulator
VPDPSEGASPSAELATLEHGTDVLRRRPRLCWTEPVGAREATIVGRTVAGSASDAGLTVAHRTVSRLHAELEPRDDGLWVRDLGSKNGTYIDDVRVEAGRAPEGGRLRLGSAVLTVSYDAVPEPVELWSTARFGPLVGRSAKMRELFARLARIAPTPSSVLVQGETGTGKELVARALHEASPRGLEPFVVVDCAALPANLLESELFGHAKGAFTGATSAHAGAFEDAHGGTVFLDEIGELPLAVQPKLLRVLESREVRRLGETSHRAVDVRIVSATHRDLQRMVNTGAFREDLYFRLAVLVIDVPPLREHSEDIPLLLEHLMGEGSPRVASALAAELAQRPWLGNVRELRNFAERARALGSKDALEMTDASGSSGGAIGGAGPAAVIEPPVSVDQPYRDVRAAGIEHVEREYFRRLLERHGRSIASVAAAAGVDRTYVYRLIRKHEL